MMSTEKIGLHRGFAVEHIDEMLDELAAQYGYDSHAAAVNDTTGAGPYPEQPANELYHELLLIHGRLTDLKDAETAADTTAPNQYPAHYARIEPTFDNADATWELKEIENGEKIGVIDGFDTKQAAIDYHDANDFESPLLEAPMAATELHAGARHPFRDATNIETQPDGSITASHTGPDRRPVNIKFVPTTVATETEAIGQWPLDSPTPNDE